MIRHKLAAIALAFPIGGGPIIQAPETLTRDELKIEELEKTIRLERRAEKRLRAQKRSLRRQLALPVIVRLGKALQKRGFRVSEHPFFDVVDPVHSEGSAHYSGDAIDVNFLGGNEPAMLDWVAGRLELMSGVTVLWRVPDHYDHLHAEAV